VKKYEENSALNIKKPPQPLIVEADELWCGATHSVLFKKSELKERFG